jgi:hypothetical protein
MQLSGQNKCLSCARTVVKSEGFTALYRSLPITFLMNAPYHVCTVVINENMKKIVEPKKRKFKFMSYFFCAAFAGGVSSFLTCPMDNIKTRLQTQSTVSSCEIIESKVRNQLNKDMGNSNISAHKSHLYSSASFNTIKNNIANDEKQCSIEQAEKADKIKYKNIKDTLKEIYYKDGIKKGLFRGVGPRILFNSPSCAIAWGSYEFMKHLFTNLL